MTEEAAIAIIQERSGTFYDPRVVDTFIRVHREIAPADAPQPQLQNALRRIRRVRQSADAVSAAVPPVPAEVRPADLSEELLAFVSLARVATHTPTVADVGALAWGHLRHIAPGASLALFTVDAVRAGVLVEFSAGPAGPRLAGAVIGMGQRVTGWVAAHARSMVNADARLDLGSEIAGDLRYVIATPLVSDGGLVGVMTLYAPEPFADDCSRRLEMIAPHLSRSVGSALSDNRRHAATAAPDVRSAGTPRRRDRSIALRAVK